MRGLHSRMGDDIRPNMAIYVEILKEMLLVLKSEYLSSSQLEEKHRISELGVILCTGFCAALRGEEIMKLTMDETLEYMEAGLRHEIPHIPMALKGRFKGETGIKRHIMPIVTITESGINNAFWYTALFQCKERMGYKGGFLLGHSWNEEPKLQNYSDKFYELIEEIQVLKPDLVGLNVNVREEYGLSRSLRRGATTRALEAGVEAEVIELNNRWRSVEGAKGKAPSLGIRQHYTEIRQVLKRLLEFSRKL